MTTSPAPPQESPLSLVDTKSILRRGTDAVRLRLFGDDERTAKTHRAMRRFWVGTIEVVVVVLTNIALTSFLRSVTAEIPWLPDSWRNIGVLMTMIVSIAFFRLLRTRIEAGELRMRHEVARCAARFPKGSAAPAPASAQETDRPDERPAPCSVDAPPSRRMSRIINRYAVLDAAGCEAAAAAARHIRLQVAAFVAALSTALVLLLYFVLWKQSVFTLGNEAAEPRQVMVPLILPAPVEQYLQGVRDEYASAPLGWTLANNPQYLVEAFRYDYPGHTALTAAIFGVAYLCLCLCATATFAFAYSRMDALLDILGLGAPATRLTGAR